MANTKTKQPWLYDIRVLHRNVAEGTLAPAEVKAHLETLPDVSGKAEPFVTALHGERDDLDEGDGPDNE